MQGDRKPKPWRRMVLPSFGLCLVVEKINTLEERFTFHSHENLELDIQAKLIALRVSTSVVSLVSYKGDRKLFVASGTIIECEAREVDDGFTCTVLTSATLLKGRLEQEASSSDDIKVFAFLHDGTSCEARVQFCDFHFNICLLKINTNGPQIRATVRSLRSLTPVMHQYEGCYHDDSISPGDKVIALGRHHQSHDLMAAPGEFCTDRCELDCDELCMASCKISLGGIGGPLVSHHGEVIGVNFYHGSYTPFLPMDIVLKCLELWKSNRSIPHFQLGVKALSLGEVSGSLFEIIIRRFPSISGGVVIEKVLVGSLAESAGIKPYDVVVECHGVPVGCPSEFFGMMLDKAGEEVEMLLMRPSDGITLRLKLVADATHTDDIYRWPVPNERRRSARINY